MDNPDRTEVNPASSIDNLWVAHRDGAVMGEEDVVHMVCAMLGEIPKHYHDAVSGEASGKWREAMEVEWKALWDQGTFEYADLPPGHKAIGCRWVFALKRDENHVIQC